MLIIQRGPHAYQPFIPPHGGFLHAVRLKNGVPHGRGFFACENGKGWYEGEVANGLSHDEGEWLYLDRTRYGGQLLGPGRVLS